MKVRQVFYEVLRLTEDIDISLEVSIEEANKIKNLFSLMELVISKEINDNFIKDTFCLVGDRKEYEGES